MEASPNHRFPLRNRFRNRKRPESLGNAVESRFLESRFWKHMGSYESHLESQKLMNRKRNESRNNFLLNSDLAETESSPGVSLSLKISQKSLVKLISDCPHVLRSEFLRKWIVPISDCVKFGLSSSAITSILEYSSRIGIGPEKKIEFLVGIGISRDNIERFFHIFPEILGIGTETRLKPLLDEFKKMGFGNDEMKKEIAIEPRVLC
ncbi:unnamed protein product [Microthlaspi erraticum]|uniref:Uncharacterized protein n=1 Tax=Microthlaspi erraticum TaxID=1685480 RepID=A0A6D2HZX0_9BRAS|nr:unnamed protein product [Microthlaspi erraticum]